MRKKSSYGVIFMVILLIMTYAYKNFQGGFVSGFLFYFFLPVALYAIAIYFLSFFGWSVNRNVGQHKMTAGESLQIQIECHRKFRFPLIYLLVQDQVSAHIDSRVEHYGNVVFPMMKKKITIDYKLHNVPRGVYYWDEITLQTGDPFGLIKREKSFSDRAELVVYPHYQEIRYWRSRNEKNLGMNYAVHKQAEDITSVMGIREYAPGDRLARIHWKASAKTGLLKTKEFEHQVTNDFMFFLDRELDSYGDESHPLFEKAVSLLASLARYSLKQHFSIGVASHGMKAMTLAMSKEQEQLYRIFEHLARVKADSTFPFIKTILREVVYLPTGTTVVIISPKLSKELAMTMGELSYRKIKVEFFWIRDHVDMLESEKSHLDLLESLQIAYHLMVAEQFNEAITGGESRVSI